MESEYRRIQEARGEYVGVREGEIPVVVGGEIRRPGSDRAAEAGGWESLRGEIVCPEETERESALGALIVIRVRQELVFVIGACLAIRREALQAEGRRGVDRLGRWDQILAIRKFVLEKRERGRIYVGSVGSDGRSCITLQSTALAGEQFS